MASTLTSTSRNSAAHLVIISGTETIRVPVLPTRNGGGREGTIYLDGNFMLLAGDESGHGGWHA